MVCCAEKPANNSTTDIGRKSIADQKNPPSESILALGVPVPKLVFADDVKAYMRDVLAAPIPSTYVLPEDIRIQSLYDNAVAKVNEHFPEFVGLENTELLRAVKNNPIKYQALILESKSVREKFFPGSQPKTNR